MRLTNKLKSLFKKKNGCSLGVHEAVMCDNVEDFHKHVCQAKCYDRHNIYYYNGDIENLKELVESEILDGEKSIDHSSLEYPQIFTSQDNTVIMTDSLFYPDDVRMFMKNYNPGDDVFYRTVSGEFKTIKKVLICKNDVYFSTK